MAPRNTTMRVSSTSNIRRPVGVTALACLFGFGTLASGLSTVSLMNPGSVLEPIWQLNPHARTAFANMGLWAPLLLVIVCCACTAAAFGFFTGRRWGHRLGVGLLITNLIGDIVNVALGIEPRAWIGIPIVAILAVYLLSPKVRAFFRSGKRAK